MLAGAALTAAQVRDNWLGPLTARLSPGFDPGFDAVDWTALRAKLAAGGWLDRPGASVAAVRWHDAGKIDYALGGRTKVICLGDDPRQYGLQPAAASDPLLVIAPRMGLAQLRGLIGGQFHRIEALAPLVLDHGGRVALTLRLFLARP